ncbi:MAG: ectoine/hydroxyectoine ABC transporter ATP-binding protein EhuA [Luteitalea sp.]|nr:ectoine/hydroxyectoine ABC transporter ATP-binding protein EhuA [Luteitalea sp.]
MSSNEHTAPAASEPHEVPIVRIHQLHKRFGELEVLRGLDLEIPEGQVVSIIGPSGSGKSTLLRILMTLERPDSGHIEIAGESLYTVHKNGHEQPAGEAHIRRVRRNIGMVFQHFNLFPHMTVLQNVTEAPIHVLGLSKEEAERIATADLERVGLGEKLAAYPAELSGGQKQRVAIARALAMHPRIMLFDEITSALDPELVGGILDLLRELAASGEMTMLVVTHVMNFARRCSHRVLFFDHGVVLEDAHPEVIFTAPSHERTREFLASILET